MSGMSLSLDLFQTSMFNFSSTPTFLSLGASSLCVWGSHGEAPGVSLRGIPPAERNNAQGFFVSSRASVHHGTGSLMGEGGWCSGCVFMCVCLCARGGAL